MWELLYETFWDRLEHFCFNLCRDEARAEDLTQEVFLRALQNRTLINSLRNGSARPGCLPLHGISTATSSAGRQRRSSCSAPFPGRGQC